MKLEGFQQWEAKLKAAEKALGFVPAATLSEVMKIGFKIAFDECPIGPTGFLRSSINYEIFMDNAGSEVGELRADAPYASYVNSGCLFSQNTKILTKRGYVDYKDLMVGYDEVYTHKQRWKKIIDKFSFKHTKVKRVTVILESGDRISVTGNHPFYNGEWIKAENLKVGDMVYTIHNDLPHLKMNLTKVVEIKQSIRYNTTVYNFSVEEDESYVSNHIVTHNTSHNKRVPFFSNAVIAMNLAVFRIMEKNTSAALQGNLRAVIERGEGQRGGNPQLRTRKHMWQSYSRSGQKRYVYAKGFRPGTVKYRGKIYRGRNYSSRFESA